MNNINYLTLIFLYIIFFIITSYYLIKNIIKTKKIELSDIFKIFYIFYYGIVPICTLIAFKKNTINEIKDYYLESNSLYIKYIAFLLSSLFYIIFNYVLAKIKSKKIKIKKNFVKLDNSNSFYLANLLLLIVGWIALLLYTRAYGGIFSTFKYAEDIRNSRCSISNNLSFLQPFTMVFLILPINFIYILSKHNNKEGKVITIIFLFLSILGCICELMIIDSRSNMLFLPLIVCYYFLKEKIMTFNKKYLIIFLCVIFISCFALINSEKISGFLHNQPRTEQQTKINDFIAQEFGYTYLDDINVIYRKINNKNGKIRIFNDILRISVSLLPRSIQEKITDNLSVYNSKFFPNSYGIVPCDIISASIYSLGYIGPIIFAIWIAIIIYLLDLIVASFKKKSKYYLIIEAFFIFYICIHLIANYDISLRIFSLFEFILLIVFVIILNLKKFNKFVDIMYNCITKFKISNFKK